MASLSVQTCAFIILLALTVSAHPKGSNRQDRLKGKEIPCHTYERNTFHFITDPSGFPEELQYTVEVEDHGNVDLRLRLDRSLSLPPSIVPDENGIFNQGPTRNQDMAFYYDINGIGTFVCQVTVRGKNFVSCDLTGIVHINEETCLISAGSSEADCTDSSDDDGALEYRRVPNSVPELSVQRARKRRNTPFPEPGYKVIEILFVVDASFMQPFYDRNVDVATAEEDAEMFITLLTNEMNVYYRSLKTVTSGALDVYTYPAAFVHPAAGSDLPWVTQHRVGNTLPDSDVVDSALRQYISSGLTNVSWDHAMTITGLDLYGQTNSLLGYAYLETTCNMAWPEYRYSLLEFTSYNLGLNAAHELAHGLGIYHDGTGINIACPANRNLMTPKIFTVSSSTVGTFHSFSSCSADNVLSYLDQHPDCLGAHGFTDVQFREAFCSGLLGERENSLDLQCQKTTGWAYSYACNSVQGNYGCYKANYVTCRGPTDTGSGCSSSLRFVWNGTPCGVGFICYRGLCRNKVETCLTI